MSVISKPMMPAQGKDSSQSWYTFLGRDARHGWLFSPI
jgi:hypothetical protein